MYSADLRVLSFFQNQDKTGNGQGSSRINL